MSSNNKSGHIAALKNIFITSDGMLRMFWQLIAALFLWLALTLITAYGGSILLMRLLDSWGVTAANLRLTPVWVQYLVSYQASLYHAVAAIIAVIAGALLTRRYRRTHISPVRNAASLLIGFFTSIFTAVALALVFVFSDSLRSYTGGGSISLHTFIMLAICAVTAASEGFLAFGYLANMARSRCSRLAGYIAGTAMFFTMNAFDASGVIGIINALLMGTLLCFIAEKHGIAPVIGIRTGWLWATTSLMSFSGSETSLMRLYTVSEDMLTGGEAGLFSGLVVTAVCIAFIWIWRILLDR